MQFQVPIRVADHGLGPTSEIKRLPRHLRAGLGEPASEEHFIQKYNFKFSSRTPARTTQSVCDVRGKVGLSLGSAGRQGTPD